MEKVCIFIDGGNFYHLVLKRLGLQDLDFDFNKFVDFLLDGRPLTENGKRFYVGTVRQKQGGHDNNQAMVGQTKLFTELSKSDWVILTSKLRTRKEKIIVDDRMEDYKQFQKIGIKEIVYERSREKGIDVKLAVDLVVGAIDEKYITAIVVSSDTDLVPAIDWVRKRRKIKVEYVGFSFPETKGKFEELRPVNKMLYNSDIQRVLVESDIRQFLKIKN